MTGRIIAGLFLCSLFIIVGGDAQNRDVQEPDKPVWTLEFIQVKPEMLGSAMRYLDNNWMRIRAEAKREGAVLDYHRIQDAVLQAHGHKVGDPHSLVLMTEYKDMAAFMESEKLFASIRERLRIDKPGVLNAIPLSYETVDSGVFVEEPEVKGGFKLLAKN